MKLYVKSLIVFISAFLINNTLSAQSGNILVICNAPAKVLVDGGELGQLKANVPGKFELTAGEHYLQVISIVTKKEKNEILDIDEGKQKVLKYEFDDAHASGGGTDLSSIQLMNVSLTIPGGFSMGLAAAGDYETSGVPVFYFSMLKDDQLEIDFNMLNKNGTNSVEIASYPDGNPIYFNNSFHNLDHLKVRIPSEGIYKIVFGTAHVFDRTGQLIFNRIPASQEVLNHNTKVVKKTKYEVVTIQEPSSQWVNSRTSLTGSTRIAIPVNLPVNTVEWYYIISSSRSKEQIESNIKAASLVKDLSKAILGYSSMGLSIGLDLVTQPPGSDYCDVFLIDHDNYQPFLAKQEFRQYTEGTRENITSAKVKVSGLIQGPYYLGIRNNDLNNGISVGVEIAAITAEDYYDVP